MIKVRQRLQDCSLCEAADWDQQQIHEWLYQMGAPRDAEVLKSDLFVSITTFDELCNELMDDSFRADYLDPEVHEGFTPQLSRRILVELKGIKELMFFKAHADDAWQKDITGAPPEEFAWMSKHQAAPRAPRRHGHRRQNASSSPRLARRSTQIVISELYAGEGSLYTTGTTEDLGPDSNGSNYISSSMASISEEGQTMKIDSRSWRGESKTRQSVDEHESKAVELRGATSAGTGDDEGKADGEVRLQFGDGANVVVNPLSTE